MHANMLGIRLYVLCEFNSFLFLEILEDCLERLPLHYFLYDDVAFCYFVHRNMGRDGWNYANFNSIWRPNPSIKYTGENKNNKKQ